MKKILLVIIIGIGIMSASAQDPTKFDQTQGTYERITKRGPYLTDRFFDNMYVNVGGGVNAYMGTDFNEGDFFKRLAPAVDISLGKWITPAIGIRMQYTGLSTTSFTHIEPFSADGSSVKREFNMMNLHGDFLWNVSNALAGYKETRTWDLIPYLGFGGARSWDGNVNMPESSRWRLSANVGLVNNFRLGELVDLNIEARYMVVNSDFDWHEGGDKIDGMFSVTAGVAIKFGGKGFKRPTQPDYSFYNQRIETLQTTLDETRRELQTTQAQLRASDGEVRQISQELKESETPIIIEQNAPASMAIFFAIGSSKISEKDMKNLSNIADYIKESPGKTFRVVGYADNSTGSVARNEQLSLLRAQSVKDALVERFGISRNQLVVESKGGVGFENNPSLSRMVKIE